MSTANKLIYLNETKTKIKDALNCGGADITTETFREYPEVLYNQYVDSVFDDGNALWDAMPKFSASGTNLSFNNTVNCRLGTELYGNTSQSNIILPSAYQQVEYIATSGTQYIDTNYVANTDTEVRMVFLLNNKDTFGLYGGQINGNDTSLRFFAASGSIYIAHGGERVQQGNNLVINTKYSLIHKKSSCIINDVSYSSSSGANFADTTLTIGRCNGFDVSYLLNGRIYSFQILENNVLLRNFIPCYRKSDNVIGMYDLVSKTFYINAGTGSFAKGDNSVLPNSDYPIDINVITGKNDIFISGKNMFNPDWWLKGYLNGNNYNYTENKSITTPKKLSAGTYTFTFTYPSAKWVKAFTYINKEDKKIDKTLFNLSTDSLTNTFTLTEDTYVRFGIDDPVDNVKTDAVVQLEKSSIASTYEAFQGYVQEINLGKNKLDVTQNTDGYYISENGTITATSGHNYTALIPVEQRTYVFSGVHTRTDNNNNKRIHGYDKNGNWVKQIGVISLSSGSYSKVFSINDTSIKYIRLSYFNDDINVQVEIGDIATSYAPYFTPIELCNDNNNEDAIVSWRSNTYLPNEYTQVQYIESSGTQYINTGYTPTLKTGFNIKASLTVENNNDKILIGSRASSNRFWIDFDGTQSTPCFMYGYGSYYKADNYYVNTIYDISYNYNGSKNLIINGNKRTMSGTFDETNTLPIYIFRANYGTGYSGSFKVYDCKIYEGTVLVRNFIPCIRNLDSKPGLYDIVTQSFFVNQGTGEFTYGLKANKWYVYKEINKATFVGDATENWYIQGDLHYQLTCAGDKKLYLKQSGVGLTNYFVVKSSGATGENFFYPILQSGTDYVRIQNGTNRWADTAAFKAWLQNHNIDFYYPTSNPTYTEITYQPLINQLEALYNAKSISGQTNIMQDNTDLPFIINASVIQPYSYEEELM